ncbi:hypothetical protein ACQ4PT_001671 [Festuca glaucescens]
MFMPCNFIISTPECPFEFRALEVTLEAICSFLDARTTELETDAYPALDELTSKISSRNLDRVRKLKSGMTRLTARVQKKVGWGIIPYQWLWWTKLVPSISNYWFKNIKS